MLYKGSWPSEMILIKQAIETGVYNSSDDISDANSHN